MDFDMFLISGFTFYLDSSFPSDLVLLPMPKIIFFFHWLHWTCLDWDFNVAPPISTLILWKRKWQDTAPAHIQRCPCPCFLTPHPSLVHHLYINPSYLQTVKYISFKLSHYVLFNLYPPKHIFSTEVTHILLNHFHTYNHFFSHLPWEESTLEKQLIWKLEKSRNWFYVTTFLLDFFLTLLGLNTEAIIQVSIHINVYNTHTQNIKN